MFPREGSGHEPIHLTYDNQVVPSESVFRNADNVDVRGWYGENVTPVEVTNRIFNTATLEMYVILLKLFSLTVVDYHQNQSGLMALRSTLTLPTMDY